MDHLSVHYAPFMQETNHSFFFFFLNYNTYNYDDDDDDDKILSR